LIKIPVTQELAISIQLAPCENTVAIEHWLLFELTKQMEQSREFATDPILRKAPIHNHKKQIHKLSSVVDNYLELCDRYIVWHSLTKMVNAEQTA